MTATAPAALQLDQVYKAFGDHLAVDGVSARISLGMV